MLLPMADISVSQIPEIWETADDKLLSVNKLKERNVEYARTNFIKTPHLIVENQETKWKIEITTQVIKESKRTYPVLCVNRFSNFHYFLKNLFFNNFPIGHVIKFV